MSDASQDAPPPLLPNPGMLAAIGLSGPLSAADLALFVEMLAGLVRAHVPLPEALRSLGRDLESRRLCKALETVQARVASGATLGEALRTHPGVFPELMISMVEQGMARNQLHTVLMELVREYRSQIRFREALWSQLFSPLATAVVLFVVVVGMGLWNLTGLYERLLVPSYGQYRIELPLTTRIVFLLGDWIREPVCWAILAGIAVLAWWGWRRLSASQRACFWFQRMGLMMPVLGEYLRTMALARCCRLLSLLLQRGLSVEGALSMAGAATGFMPARMALREITRKVAAGEPFENALRSQAFFPATFIQMAATAQRQGELPQALSRMAELYEERGDLQGAKVRFLIFVIAQVSVSLFVLLLGAAYFSPIFGFQSAIRRK